MLQNFRLQFLFLVLSLGVPDMALGDISFSLGGLGKYKSLSISQGSSKVSYVGYGSGLDARLLLTPKANNKYLGVEVFYQFDQIRGRNSVESSEILKLSQSSFGLDLTFSNFFIGGKVSTSYGAIESSSQNYGISFDRSGVRGGLNFALGNYWVLKLGGSSTSGTLLYSQNPQVGSDRSVSSQSGFIELGLRVTE